MGERHSRGKPSYGLEASMIAQGIAPVAGVDEAGRGPLAGPVVAAAVILDARSIPDGIDDSKAMDAERREELFAAIMASGARVGIGIAEVSRIDRMNILRATLWAMSRAVSGLPAVPRLVLVDGNQAPELACEARLVIGGDAISLSIAAASIVAKVTRDRMMLELAGRCPGYGFERHKGYGTREHLAALARLGASEHHRRSFAPVRLAIEATSRPRAAEDAVSQESGRQRRQVQP